MFEAAANPCFGVWVWFVFAEEQLYSVFDRMQRELLFPIDLAFGFSEACGWKQRGTMKRSRKGLRSEIPSPLWNSAITLLRDCAVG